ncbi:SDR family NAD(P)-dependent oxidoreductase [Thermoplasma sp.]|uniref:SDR family NAD(P)-dependent oxidoreductase n=1 Tax=Thermoplasma sp. TaxID=1973142 RepID=UPI00260054F6|nr:glucose 1-dehydrogenase [Thermoplasma sp.]
MPGVLDGKISVVTGSGNGIGKEIALLFSKNGSKVILAEYDESSGRSVETEIRKSGGIAEFIKTDVSNEDSCRNTVDQVIRKYGGIDVLVNNAGVDGKNPRLLADLTQADFDSVYNVNFKGSWFMAKYVIPHMIEKGSGNIVNIASLGGIMPIATGMPYSVSKASLIMLTKMIALEYGKKGIRSNAIAPGWIETSMPRRFTDLSGIRFEDFVRSISERAPLSRLGKPEEIAEMALYLASDDSSYVTGQTFIIDGGLSIT